MQREIEHPMWPQDPYKGLANYEFEDQRLFAGRQAEIDSCAQLLAHAQTKLLILHGQTGCGKSSFLRAGLIPALEKNGAAYLFLRRESVKLPGQLEPSFIRCGPDPLARIAEEVFLFTREPLTLQTASGSKTFDLSPARMGLERLDEFIAACTNPHKLCFALEKLSRCVPHTLVLILDQAEEVITLNTSNVDNRSRFARFIKEMTMSDIDIRFVIAIRKDHSGQFIGSIQVDSEISLAFRTFFLTDLSENGIRQAILRPTLKTLVEFPDSPGPYQHYQFEFAPSVVDQILADLNDLIPAGAKLPVMQIVCRDLFDQIKSQPAPRLIELPLYAQDGGVKGRVKRHVMRALREVVGGGRASDASMAEIELKWLYVLKRLVQEEGDGRVHTDVVPRKTLQEWATTAGIELDVALIVDKLADPNVLILRKFTVFAPGTDSERELLCLGHDMVGIALGEALRDAESRRFVGVAVRKRFRQLTMLWICASVLVAGVLTMIYFTRTKAVRSQNIAALLAVASQGRQADVLESLAKAKQALEVSKGDRGLDELPRQMLATLLSRIPVTVAVGGSAPPLDPKADIYPTYAIGSPARFAALRSGGVLKTYTVIDSKISEQTFLTPEPLKAVDGKLPLQSLAFSDASSDLLLSIYRTVEGGDGSGVIGFSKSGASKLFSRADLVNALGAKSRTTEDMDLFGLNGPSIVLYALSKDMKSIHLQSLRMSNSMHLSKGIDVTLQAASSYPQVNGRNLVFFSYNATQDKSAGVPNFALTRIESKDVFSDGKPQVWNSRDFLSVRNCVKHQNDTQPTQPCDLTVVPDLQQEGLTVLGLWELTNGRYGSNRRGYISNLIIVDLHGSVATEVDLRLAAATRKSCGLDAQKRTLPAVPSPGKVSLSDDDVPTFLISGSGGLLLGYATRTSAQLINVSSPDMPCKEIYFPDAQIDAWRASDGGNKLLGVTRNGGFVWDLTTAIASDNESLSKTLARACAGQLQQLVSHDTVSPPITPRETLVNEICHEQ